MYGLKDYIVTLVKSKFKENFLLIDCRLAEDNVLNSIKIEGFSPLWSVLVNDFDNLCNKILEIM